MSVEDNIGVINASDEALNAWDWDRWVGFVAEPILFQSVDSISVWAP